MKVIIKFECDNDAFKRNFSNEVAEILIQAANKIIEQAANINLSLYRIPTHSYRVLIDSNGNSIGKAILTDDNSA